MRTIELFRLPHFDVHNEDSTYKERVSFQVNLPVQSTIKNFTLIPEPKSSEKLVPYLVLEVSGSPHAFKPVVFHAIINASEVLPNTQYVGTFDTLHTHEENYVVDPPVRYHLYMQKRERAPRKSSKST